MKKIEKIVEKIKKEAVDPNKEDRPDIVVPPPCEPKIVYDEKTGVVEAVYSGSCSIKQVQQIAGKIAIEGIRFRPEIEEKPEETEEPIRFLKPKDTIESLEKKLVELKKQRAKVEEKPEEKKIMDTTKEELKKDFEEKVSACESGKSESCKSTESES